MRNAADELGRANVRVNAVRPSLVPTELAAPLEQDPAVLADYLANMPISRTGTVDDVAHLIRFLCGPESSWITGRVHQRRRWPHPAPGPERRALGPGRSTATTPSTAPP